LTQEFTMNNKHFYSAAAIAFALTAATSAFAQEATSDDWMNASATKTRAQVQAELTQARQDGTIRAWSAGYMEPVKSAKTRAEVVAATLGARQSGELAAIDSEAYRFSAPAVTAVRLATSAR
jgi:hypothetical protein